MKVIAIMNNLMQKSCTTSALTFRITSSIVQVDCLHISKQKPMSNVYYSNRYGQYKKLSLTGTCWKSIFLWPFSNFVHVIKITLLPENEIERCLFHLTTILKRFICVGHVEERLESFSRSTSKIQVGRYSWLLQHSSLQRATSRHKKQRRNIAVASPVNNIAKCLLQPRYS